MLNELRFTIRSLGKNRGFTAVAVVTLAVGIGATTAIFSVVNGVLLRPLPYPNADRIVQVWTTSANEAKGSFGPPDFVEFQRTTRTIDRVAGYREDPVTVAVNERDPVRETAALVTIDYFDVFGTGAALGRTFMATVDQGTREPLVVIGASTWRNLLSSDPNVIGRRLRINGVAHTILGVMPDSFNYPAGARLWVLSDRPVPPPPIEVPGDLLEMRGIQYFLAVGRLAPGATAAQAQADLAATAADIARRYPASNTGRGVLVEPLHERIVGDVRRALLVLLGAVGTVLLIACANVASLLLARASGRQRELAVRAALGASRGRLARQLLGEALVLAAAGGALGLAAARWTLTALVGVIPPGVPRVEEIALDSRVYAAAFLLSVVSAVLFGLVPSLQASRTETAAVLRGGGDRGSTGGRRRARTRAGLVVAEIALTLLLLVSAALLGNSLLRLQRTDPGFDAGAVTIVSMPLPQARYPDRERQAGFYEQLLEGLQRRGEIEVAAVAFPGPLDGSHAAGAFTIEGRPGEPGADRPYASIASVSPEYLRVMGIPLIAGRHFTAQDRRPAQPTAIVNATLVRRYLPGENPVGRRIRFGETEADWMTIVGVSGDSRNRGLDSDPSPLVYISYQHFSLPFLSVVARSAGGPGAVATAVREEVRRLDRELPVDRVRPLTEVVRASVAAPFFRTLLLGAFAATALLLAIVGVYGLISYSVSQRRREIGIRVALGATRSRIVGSIVREG